ncbi:hypothetical protein MASR2M15_09890 [Anaerolineales bacterium]
MEIIPRYRLLLTYDLRDDAQDKYYRYMMAEFIPAVQEMGVYMYTAWHTTYGNYPDRQIELVTDSDQAIITLLTSEKWQELETKLKDYVHNYNRKLVHFRRGFQL